MGWSRRGIFRYLPHATIVPRPQLPVTIASLPPGARVCDVGAGGRRLTENVVTVDFIVAPGVDVAGDIHKLPLLDNSVDCVICTGTLEHVRHPETAVRELRRILRPGGIVHIDTPFMQAYHPDPTDYWRFTLEGLRLLCSEFEEIDAGVHIGPTCGVVWIVREWMNSWSANRIISNLLLVPTAFVTAPFRYLDYLMVGRPRGHHAAAAVYFRGRKPAPRVRSGD